MVSLREIKFCTKDIFKKGSQILFNIFIPFFLIFILTVSCDSKQVASSKSDTNDLDSLMVPTPVGVYEPTGLRKLNVAEMAELPKKPGFSFGNFVWKDHNGNVVDTNYFRTGGVLKFVQFYLDEDGSSKEAVVSDMTPEAEAVLRKYFTKTE
jgi:hypothetical protein